MEESKTSSKSLGDYSRKTSLPARDDKFSRCGRDVSDAAGSVAGAGMRCRNGAGFFGQWHSHYGWPGANTLRIT